MSPHHGWLEPKMPMLSASTEIIFTCRIEMDTTWKRRWSRTTGLGDELRKNWSWLGLNSAGSPKTVLTGGDSLEPVGEKGIEWWCYLWDIWCGACSKCLHLKHLLFYLQQVGYLWDICCGTCSKCVIFDTSAVVLAVSVIPLRHLLWYLL